MMITELKFIANRVVYRLFFYFFLNVFLLTNWCCKSRRYYNLMIYGICRCRTILIMEPSLDFEIFSTINEKLVCSKLLHVPCSDYTIIKGVGG